MIEKINDLNMLGICQNIIQQSFKTVAENFGLTVENCPNHTSFITEDKLKKQFSDGADMFLYEKDEKYIGYFSLIKKSRSVYELDNLSVFPEFRHMGISREMVEYAKNYANLKNGETISIGIIEENTVLKEWYKQLGFEHKGTKKFEHLPFTVGFMELSIN